MKVICAGFSKTGTKSMQAALKQLGYNVYDFMENITYLGDDWIRICTKGGTTEDFRRMFENIDAVTDIPACYFWDEIHKAFPEAKIILTIREDENAWVKSWSHQIAVAERPIVRILRVLSPTYRAFSMQSGRIVCTLFGINADEVKGNIFQAPKLNMLLARMTYRRHNAHVLQNAPKDKLLVYNVKEGWEPLCNFLEVEVPSTPFPHKNKRGDIVREYFQTEPLFIRARREFMLSLSLIGFALAYGAFKLYKSSPSTWYDTVSSLLSSLWTKLPVGFLRKM